LKRSISFLLILLTLAIQSCTVGYSFTGADIPAAAESFSVKTFQVVAPLASPNYKIQVTEQLKDLLLSQTRLDLVEKRGDIQYEGVVTEYVIGNAAVSGDEQTTVNRLTISVKVKYVNTIDKEKNFERTFTQFADYDSQENFSAVEDRLVQDINELLIQDIFNGSLGAW
jgi:hypothetical protein